VLAQSVLTLIAYKLYNRYFLTGSNHPSLIEPLDNITIQSNRRHQKAVVGSTPRILMKG